MQGGMGSVRSRSKRMGGVGVGGRSGRGEEGTQTSRHDLERAERGTNRPDPPFYSRHLWIGVSQLAVCDTVLSENWPAACVFVPTPGSPTPMRAKRTSSLKSRDTNNTRPMGWLKSLRKKQEACQILLLLMADKVVSPSVRLF